MPARLRAAVRVAGVLLLLALVGAFLSVASAFAAGAGAEAPAPQAQDAVGGLHPSTVARGALSSVVPRQARDDPEQGRRVEGQPARVLRVPDAAGQLQPVRAGQPLTIDRALELAITRNETLKVTSERLRESQARVAGARAAFLPTLDVNFLYTPTQASPALRIPAGIFGPDEQTFRVNMIRENVVRFDVSQPIYTGGRLAHAYGAEAAAEEGSRLELERARDTLTLRVYETFYAALMAEQGVADF